MFSRVAIACLLFAACTDGGDGGTTVTGNATYRDASTNHDGSPKQPAAPTSDAKITLIVKGSGQIPQVDARCATDPAGSFEAKYAGTAQMGNTYLATVGSGKLTTPSGCEINDISTVVVTDVVVRGSLTITSQNCQTYCQAKARADAESSCGATASMAACRAQAESQAEASCMTTCTSSAKSIEAEVSLGASALGQVDADKLRGALFGDLSANLKFDHFGD